MKNNLTEEQLEFVKSLSSPTFCAANAGTGKTHSLVYALDYAVHELGIRGENIMAMSYTNEATNMLRERFRKYNIDNGQRVPKVTFCTIHSSYMDIVRTHANKLPFTEPENLIVIGGGAGTDRKESEEYTKIVVDFTRDSLEELLGYRPSLMFSRRVLNTVKSYNSKFLFDDGNIEEDYTFKKLKIDINVFKEVRKALYNLQFNLNLVFVENQPLLALQILEENPDISAKLKAYNKIIAVDEFQDVSPVILYILSKMTNNLTVIGDLKQQIYAFNGASLNIFKQYLDVFPNAKVLELTQSFRVPHDIAEFANEIIKPNKLDMKDLEGRIDFSSKGVSIKKDYNLSDVVLEIKKELEENLGVFSSNKMFLYRNNYSSINILEHLYRNKVPAILSSPYPSAVDIPLLEPYLAVFNLAQSPTILTPKIASTLYIMCPSLKELSERKGVKISYLMKEKKIPITELLSDDYYEQVLLNRAIKKIQIMLRGRHTVSTLMEAVDEEVHELFISKRSFYWDMTEESMMWLLKPVIDKPLDDFYIDEIRKKEYFEKTTARGIGVTVNTMHKAKGLESDDVYILGVDAQVLPSRRRISEYMKTGCYRNALQDIRSDRSLLYVAITRAKKSTTIGYFGEPSTYIVDQSEYEYIEDKFDRDIPQGDDISAFLEFIRR